MKFSEYVTMLRAGYTKAEIDAIVLAERENAEQPAPIEPEQPAPAEPEQAVHAEQEDNAPAWAVSLSDSIKHLTSTVQAMNRAALEQPAGVESDVDNVLKTFITGPEKRN